MSFPHSPLSAMTAGRSCIKRPVSSSRWSTNVVAWCPLERLLCFGSQTSSLLLQQWPLNCSRRIWRLAALIPSAKYGLSLLLVLFLAQSFCSPGTPVFQWRPVQGGAVVLLFTSCYRSWSYTPALMGHLARSVHLIEYFQNPIRF